MFATVSRLKVLLSAQIRSKLLFLLKKRMGAPGYSDVVLLLRLPHPTVFGVLVYLCQKVYRDVSSVILLVHLIIFQIPAFLIIVKTLGSFSGNKSANFVKPSVLLEGILVLLIHQNVQV